MEDVNPHNNQLSFKCDEKHVRKLKELKKPSTNIYKRTNTLTKGHTNGLQASKTNSFIVNFALVIRKYLLKFI